MQAATVVALVAVTIAAQALLVAALALGLSITLLVIIRRRRQQPPPAFAATVHHVPVAHCNGNPRRQWQRL